MSGHWTPAYRSQFDPDHELAGEPVCKRFAWLDLCNLTQHQPVTRMIDYKPVRIERGQFIASERFLAERWRWSRGKVQRFLAYLEHPDVRKIRTVECTRGGTIYALPTYEKYALGSDDTRQKTVPLTDPPIGPLPGHRNGNASHDFRDNGSGERSTDETTGGSSADPLAGPKNIRSRRSIYPQLTARDDLADWLGEYAEPVGGLSWLDDRARRSMLAQYGPGGMRANAWRLPSGGSVPADDRPRLLALALVSYDGEGKRRVVTSEFDGLLRKLATQEVDATEADALTETPEQQYQRYLAIRRELMAKGMSDDEAEAEAERMVTT